MATLVFTAIGTALGGPLGGAIGALLGRQTDARIFAPPGREGPRLQDLTFTTSSYGAVLPRHYGRMRVGGTVIWATDLAETRHTQGGGKGRPAVTSYSYAASFAVALASRPLAGIGRIWADGTLLRGSAGDLKVGGQLRFHAGYGDQAPDPLLAAAEGSAFCPAYRGTAYVVFEDLQLADFGNRLPTLSFEVFADDPAGGPPDLATLGADAGIAVAGAVPLAGLAGLSVEGPLAETLGLLAPVFPFACDCADDRLALDAGAGPVRDLGEATTAVGEPGAAGAQHGFVRTMAGSETPPPGLLRYYDVDRDYQAGVQRAAGRPGPGAARAIELPAALAAAAAQQLVEGAARRAGWGRQGLTWRTATLDPAIAPGALVRVPGQAGVWRVTGWEWRASGIELALVRVPGAGLAVASGAFDAGRAVLAGDYAGGPTLLGAWELPWDGTGSAEAQPVHVAASSAAAGWSGAALFADDGAGGLTRLGATGRARCVLGQAVEALPAASSLVGDRASGLVVQLVADDLDLTDATGRQLAQGANRALLGAELIQFARAEPLGRGRWRLSGLLRGRGGSEGQTAGHVAGESFVLLDERLTVLDGAQLTGRLAASGLGDAEPVFAEVGQRGRARQPLSPVHARVRTAADGALELGWTRRARGAWAWLDQVDVPLREEAEAYEVVAGSEAAPLALWQTAEPRLTLPAGQVGALRQTAPGAALQVRQRGSFGVSPALFLTTLS